MWIWEKYTTDIYSDEERIVPRNYQTYGDSLIKDDIDVIAKRPTINKVEFVGLRQAEFEYFVEKYGNQFESISLFKCPFISDFSPFENVSKVKHINIFWNNKANRLWNMHKNFVLKSLCIKDFKSLEKIDHLFDGAQIEELIFGGNPFVGNQKYLATSLNFLTRITTLQYLSIDSIDFNVLDFTPITRLINLKEFDFPLKQFTTEQMAWLSAKMPILGISAYVTFPTFCQIAGKRKPTLIVGKDDKHIEKYAESFNVLVDYYRKNVGLPCP